MEPSAIAAELVTAERDRRAIQPFTDRHPDLDVSTAYRAQASVVQSRLESGERFLGYKLGLTSGNKQRAMGSTRLCTDGSRAA